MSFKDWLESKGYMDGYGTDYQDAYDEGFDEGAKSQQAKIDLLEKELTETQAFLNNQNHIKQAKIDELQASIDDALDMLKGRKGKVLLDDIVDTLKGNKDEN